MPSSTQCVNPAFSISAAIFLSLACCAICSATIVSHPSHLFSSVLVQSDASLAHRRFTLSFFFQSSIVAATAFAKSSGNLYVSVFIISSPPRPKPPGDRPCVLLLLPAACQRRSQIASRRLRSAYPSQPSSKSLPSQVPAWCLARPEHFPPGCYAAFHDRGTHRRSRAEWYLPYPCRLILRHNRCRCMPDFWCWCWPIGRAEFVLPSPREHPTLLR